MVAWWWLVIVGCVMLWIGMHCDDVQECVCADRIARSVEPTTDETNNTSDEDRMKKEIIAIKKENEELRTWILDKVLKV